MIPTTSPKRPIPTAAVFAGAPPPVIIAVACVEAGAFVVSTTVPDVVTTTTLDANADCDAEAIEDKIRSADFELYVLVAKLQWVRMS
jgi:hypothetical protein